MKNELAKMAKRYNEIYFDFENGLCGFTPYRTMPAVQLTKEGFAGMFSDEKPKYKADIEQDHYEKSVVYDGVQFFCLLDREEYEDETF